jgi:hypothetical protein
VHDSDEAAGSGDVDESSTWWRVVADPEALDRMEVPRDAVLWRLAPDDVLIDVLIGFDDPEVESKLAFRPQLDDPHAIVVPDQNWHAQTIDADSFEPLRERIEWEIDNTRINQGLILGVPAKIQFLDHRPELFGSDTPWPHYEILCAAPYAHELNERVREVLGE